MRTYTGRHEVGKSQRHMTDKSPDVTTRPIKGSHSPRHDHRSCIVFVVVVVFNAQLAAIPVSVNLYGCLKYHCFNDQYTHNLFIAMLILNE